MSHIKKEGTWYYIGGYHIDDINNLNAILKEIGRTEFGFKFIEFGKWNFTTNKRKCDNIMSLWIDCYGGHYDDIIPDMFGAIFATINIMCVEYEPNEESMG